MKMRSLVISDLDGTLLDYRRRAYMSFCCAMERYTKSSIDFREFVKLRIEGKSNYEIFLSCTAARIEAREFEFRVIEAIESKELLMEDTFFEDSLTWISEIQDMADFVICTSRRNPENLIWQLRQFGLDWEIDNSILVAATTKLEVLNRYINQNNHARSKLIKLGDSYADMMTGKNIGAKLYFVARGLCGASQVSNEFDCTISENLPESNLLI